MTNKTHLQIWREAIAAECVKRLQRSLTEEEEKFITGHVGFMALEAIEDAEETLSITALVGFLNSKAEK